MKKHKFTFQWWRYVQGETLSVGHGSEVRRMSLDLRRQRNPEATGLDGFSTQGMRTTRTAAGFGPKRITVSQVLK